MRTLIGPIDAGMQRIPLGQVPSLQSRMQLNAPSSRSAQVGVAVPPGVASHDAESVGPAQGAVHTPLPVIVK